MTKPVRNANARKATRPRGNVPAPVVELSSVRALRRRELADRRVREAMEDNRAALSRLFASGLIFTQTGARAGRELLLAHQALLKVLDLFTRLGNVTGREDHGLNLRAEEVFAQLDGQLARTAQLTARAGEFLSGRGRE